MIDLASIKKEVKQGLKDKTILSEDDAREIAKKHISEDEPCYEITLAIHGLLPKKVGKVVISSRFKHPWFKGKVQHLVFVDTFGRTWSRSKGVINPKTPVRKGKHLFMIDALGGMVWGSKKGRTFVCEYRTSEEDLNARTKPQTFIG